MSKYDSKYEILLFLNEYSLNNPETVYITHKQIAKETLTKLNLKDQDLHMLIDSLVESGLVTKIEIAKGSVLISITQKGRDFIDLERKNSRKEKINRIEKIFALIAAIITVILFWPTIVGYITDLIHNFRPIEDYLVIHEAKQAITNGYLAIKPEIDLEAYDPNGKKIKEFTFGCLDFEGNCDFLLLVNGKNYIPNILIDVTTDSKDTPLKINGLDVTLSAYKQLPDSTLDYMIPFYCGGGGGGYNIYQINNFQNSNENSSSLYLTQGLSTVSDPENLVGKRTEAKAICESNDCNEVLYVNSEQVEGLELRMPFLNDLPPGWYEFIVQVSFSYKNQEYLSNSKYVLDVVKPNIVKPWWWHCNSKPFPSFVDIDLINKSVIPNLSFNPIQNENAILIINSLAGNENGFFTIDLHSGTLHHIGGYEFVPPRLIRTWPPNSQISSDGFKWAFETYIYPIIYEPSVNISLLDIENEKISIISPNDSNRHIDPAFSPDGRFISYVSFINQFETSDLALGEADIYVYDIDTKSTQRLTKSPDLIEVSPIWISDSKIAFLIPEITLGRSVSGEYDLFDQKYVGLEILDQFSKESKIFNIYSNENTRIEYFPKQNVILLKNASFNEPLFKLFLDNGNIQEVELPIDQNNESGCRLIDVLPDLFLCQREKYSEVSIYRKLGRDFLLVYYEKEGEDNSLLIGKATSDNFAIANLQKNVIHEFTKEGVFVKDWNIPDLSTLLHFYSTIYDLPEFLLITFENHISNNDSKESNIYQDWNLVERIIDGDRKDLNTSIKFRVPFIDKAVSQEENAFNDNMQNFVDNQMSEFVEELKQPIEDITRFITVNYSITTRNNWELSQNPGIIYKSEGIVPFQDAVMFSGHRVLSVLFNNFVFFGGIHPNTIHNAINFDFSTGQVLDIKDLFIPDSPYLEAIAEYCIRDLSTREEYLFKEYKENASAKPENYRVWSMTPKGLLIIFEEYQVAPYVEGPQYVLIPYEFLENIINPDGPLNNFAK